MRQFKTGDKVRFRQNGVFGNMNKYMYANNVMLDREYEVIDITGGVARIISYGLYFDVPLGCLELVPEPQPKLANIKVGDWVKLRCGKNYQVKSVDKVYFTLDGWGCDANARYDFNGNNMYKEFCGSNDIVKILSPKEVIVDFGSGIAGTIERRADSICVFNKCGKLVAWIYLSLLDLQTRAKVESILKAQEEACHN